MYILKPQGDKDGVCDGAHHVAHDVASFVRGGDVQEYELIRARSVIDPCLFYRVACIAQVQKVHPFDHASVADVKTRDNAFG